jgi:4-hydroxythreonine-4-phosphate dehydrogenase
VISLGCPSGIGPEVAVSAAAKLLRVPRVLVGDERTILDAADLVGVSRARLVRYSGGVPRLGSIAILPAGPPLRAADRRPGRPSRAAGVSQLESIERAFDLVKGGQGRALVTGPVNKSAIARSGARGASRFRGHTDWLAERDGAPYSVMCFASPKLVTSLATTHVPVAKLARAIGPLEVERAIVELVRLLKRLGLSTPRVVVCSLNPHASEDGILGDEERKNIVPGARRARARLRAGARVVGPIGAETAYRLANAGSYDGVVAMYHDQATIPMKLLSFGAAVNVTMGLSIVRTSVDHGTAYDIAWQGKADPLGMREAIRLGVRLLSSG